MADEKHELLSIKRARLCSEAASDEEHDSADDFNKADQDYNELKRRPAEERQTDQKINPNKDLSREQDGGQTDSLHDDESPESDDFPSTSGVENNTKDSSTEDFLPIAGKVTGLSRQMRQSLPENGFEGRHVC